MGEVAEISMLWLCYSQAAHEVITEGITEDDIGMEFTLKASDILPDRLMVLCELTADVPTDRQARALTAINLNDRGLISKSRAMSDIGVTDVAKMEEQIWQERMDENEAAISIKNRAMMADEQIKQQMLQQAMMMIQQEMMQAQQEQIAQQGAPVEQGGRSLMPAGPGGSPQGAFAPMSEGMGPEGEMVNPAGGGTSFAAMSPNMTKEGQTAQTRSGEDIVA